MGAADGTVQGLTKLIDSGPDDQRFNIIIVAEGFQSSEQNSFNDTADDMVAALQSEPWFVEMGQAVNVYRLNVDSNQSGADDPLTCADESTGSGTSVATFFDATFCGGSGVRRCLSGDEELVRDTLDAQLPQWHAAAVLVNSSDRGGCANGNVFWTALSADVADVFIHELGHAAFNVADEYHYLAGCSSDETDHDNAPGMEPGRRNVTAQTLREQIKWRYFIHPTTAIPTMVNPDCSQCDDRPNVLSDDTTIGLYEGANTFHCGNFRPAYTCRMRDSSQPFCRVCVDAIADVLRPFLDTEPTVEIEPGALEFGRVAFGLTLHLSFEVKNVRVGAPVSVDINLADIVGDSAFSYPLEVERTFRLPAPVFESHTSRRVWVAFTAVDDGTPVAVGMLNVSSSQPADGLPSTVTLSGEAVEVPPVDTVLVIDRSGSMEEDTGVPGLNKRDMALEAARLYISLLKDTDRIGVVRYNNLARNPEDILTGMRVATDAGKGIANGVLTPGNLDPDGLTSIGGGIILGSDVLDGGVADQRAVLVLTDGIQNTNPDIPEGTAHVLTKTPRQRVFSVGLGLNQLQDRLVQIATVTNGTAQITGDLIAEREFLLQKLYVQILSDVADEAFVRDPKRIAWPGETQSTNVYLGEVDIAADFIVVFRSSYVFPKYMRVWLEAPDGSTYSAADAPGMGNLDYKEAQGNIYFRFKFPVAPVRPDAHVGRWKVWVENRTGGPVALTHVSTDDVYTGSLLYYAVMVKARSNMRLGGRVEQLSYDPGSPITIVLEPTLYGRPVRLIEPVVAEVDVPNVGLRTVTLTRDLAGLYKGFLTETVQEGAYQISADVTARSPQNRLLTRHRRMTGIIFRPGRPSGDGHGPGGPDGGPAGGTNGDTHEFCEKCCREILARLDKLIAQQKG